jgi:hypothetical protein
MLSLPKSGLNLFFYTVYVQYVRVSTSGLKISSGYALTSESVITNFLFFLQNVSFELGKKDFYVRKITNILISDIFLSKVEKLVADT